MRMRDERLDYFWFASARVPSGIRLTSSLVYCIVKNYISGAIHRISKLAISGLILLNSLGMRFLTKDIHKVRFEALICLYVTKSPNYSADGPGIGAPSLSIVAERYAASV